MIDAMYNAVLLPKVRYDKRLSATARLIFCEMTACVDENQMMDDNPDYFADELHLPAADVQTAWHGNAVHITLSSRHLSWTIYD